MENIVVAVWWSVAVLLLKMADECKIFRLPAYILKKIFYLYLLCFFPISNKKEKQKHGEYIFMTLNEFFVVSKLSS